MTKLNWDSASFYERDPGTIIGVPDTTLPWTPPEESKLRDAERAEERRALRQRSEQHDWEQFTAQLEARIRSKEALGIPLSGWDRLVLAQRPGNGD